MLRSIPRVAVALVLVACGSTDETSADGVDAATDDGASSHDAGAQSEGGADASVGDGGASDGGRDGADASNSDGGVDGAGLDGGVESGADASSDASADATSSDASADGSSDASADAASSDASADAARDSGSDAATEAGSDGGVLSSACGDTGGLQVGAPWPMRGRCPTRMARADVAGPARANLKWSQRIGPSVSDIVDYGSVVSSPVVAADGTIYVGVQGTGTYSGGLVAYASDGTFKWHYDTGHADVRGGAVVRADGSLVLATSAGNAVALESTGQVRWSTSLGAQAFASPLVGPDGTIYFGTQSGVTALRADGSFAWSSAGCVLGTGGGSLHPDGTIRYNCGTNVRVLLPNGTAGSPNLPATDDAQTIYAPPTIAPDGVVWYSGLSASGIAGITKAATLYSYGPQPGFQKRSFDWDSTAMFNSPALLPTGNAVTGVPYHVGGSQGAVVSAPASGGSSMIGASSTQRIVAQPSVDVAGNIYFLANATLVSIGPTGTPRWSAAVDSNVQIGIAIGADGTIYVGTVNGWLYAFGL